MRKIKLGLIGAGERGGNSYAPYALKYPNEVAFTCVAEPIDERRNAIAAQHHIPSEQCYPYGMDLLAAKPEVDGIIIATQDRQHYELAMEALAAGYHVLLEKPMAETLEKTRAIVAQAEKHQRLLIVCHVLRYTPFFSGMKKIIESGAIGKIQAVHHLENIGNFHFAHSYVRGNWHNTVESTPMIVAKCCHDMDILNFLIGKKCERLSSFGSLSYFTPENAPEGAAARCIECEHNKRCIFSAYNYLVPRGMYPGFKNIVLRTDDPQVFLEHLDQSPYSRCVFDGHNDACDRQAVMMEYEGGITATFTVSAFSNDISRKIKIMGSLGEIEGTLEENKFVVRDFGTGNETTHDLIAAKTLHSGGDEKIMECFCAALKDPAQALLQYSASQSLEGHVMAFEAEESRLHGGQVIDL
ncbi:MAG: Gfo/Idh/MocA family oxidoreductase [Clostridiales bacterium]|nr:Gfo/Idh/MocA family oxidoreductase [Clostridiales bacterium]